MMFAVTAAGILVTMVLALARAFRGPTVFDRILAANMLGTKTILLIAVSGFLQGRPEWTDLAIVYALVNFAGTIAVLKFARFQDMAAGGEDKAPDGEGAPKPDTKQATGGEPA